MRKLRMSELNRLTTKEFHESEKFPVAIVLDNVRSTLNVGSVFRTADAFRCDQVLLCGLCPTPENTEMRKTALGGTESVNWKQFDNTLDAVEQLKNDGFKILAVEQTTDAISLEKLRTDSDEKLAFVFGNEVTGVDEKILEHCDAAIEIPQFGTKHSLNISVSAGIVLWKSLELILARQNQ